jgi:hypothetical protein
MGYCRERLQPLLQQLHHKVCCDTFHSLNLSLSLPVCK